MMDKRSLCDMADRSVGGQTGSGLWWTVINSIMYFVGQCCTLDKHSCCYMVDIVLHGRQSMM